MGVFYTVRSFVFRVSYFVRLLELVHYFFIMSSTLFIFDHTGVTFSERTVHVVKMNYNVIE